MATNNFEKQILSRDWHFYVTRRFNWFVENTQILANRKDILTDVLGFDVSQENYLVLNGDEYYTDEEGKKLFLVLDSYSNNNPRFFDKFASREFEIVNEILKYIQHLKTKKFKNYSNLKLAKELKKFQRVYTRSFIPAFSRPDDYLEDRVISLLRNDSNLSEKKVQETFRLIATYPRIFKLAYTDEPLELLKIASEIQKGKYNIRKLPYRLAKDLDNHVEKYSWMKGPVLVEHISFAKKDYLERLSNLLIKNVDEEVKKIENVRRQENEDYLRLRKRLKGVLLSLAESLRKFIFLRTYTTEASDNLFFVARHTLLQEAADRLGAGDEEIVMLTSGEIADKLNGSNLHLKEIINERNKGYAIFWLNGKASVLFGQDALKLQDLVAERFKGEKQDVKNKNVIKGKSASLGRVGGIVKVLFSYKDVAKVKKGDILVASMTTPDYVVAMEKAAAFVTDEGGITCHAAIVAREFRVPCIVGTGNATKVLKDGDMVEVDAISGIVRILSD